MPRCKHGRLKLGVCKALQTGCVGQCCTVGGRAGGMEWMQAADLLHVVHEAGLP